MEKTSRIVRGRTELYVPSSASFAGEVCYVSPAIQESYRNVGAQILKSGDIVPVGDLTAPLVHEIYCGDSKDEPEFVAGKGILQNRFLYVYNKNLHAFEGLFSVKDRNAEGLSKMLTVNELKQRLVGGKTSQCVEFSSDGEVAFAPRGSYAFGEMEDAGKLALDGAVIAQYGVEGAKLLAEASANLRNKPKTYGVDVKEGQKPVQTVSALYVRDGRLLVIGIYWIDYSVGGYAFPVSAPR